MLIIKPNQTAFCFLESEVAIKYEDITNPLGKQTNTQTAKVSWGSRPGGRPSHHCEAASTVIGFPPSHASTTVGRTGNRLHLSLRVEVNHCIIKSILSQSLSLFVNSSCMYATGHSKLWRALDISKRPPNSSVCS